MEGKSSFDYFGYIKEELMAGRYQELFEAVPALKDVGRLINVASELYFPVEDGASCIADVDCYIALAKAVDTAEEGPLLLHRQHAERIIADLAQIWAEHDREVSSVIEAEAKPQAAAA